MLGEMSGRDIHYFDVIVGLLTLAVVGSAVAITVDEGSTWNHYDIIGIGGYFLAVVMFALLRKRVYMGGGAWYSGVFAAIAMIGLLILFRRWSTIWMIGVGVLLLSGVVMQSRRLGEPGSRKEWQSLALITASIMFTLTVLEGALRLAPGLLPEGARLRVHWQTQRQAWYVPHPYIGHLHLAEGHASAGTARPGIEAAGQRDHWGFRNTWPWPQQVDILAIGDSFTYSQMVNDDQAWTTLLAQQLPDSRVLNLGLIGGAPQQYLRIYETFGMELSPKVLLIGLFLGNDLWGAGEFARWWESGGEGAFPEFGRKEQEPGIQGWVLRRVRSLYLHALLQDLRDSLRAGRFLRGRSIELASGQRIQLVPSLLAQAATYIQPERPEFAVVVETLERIQALAQHHETHVVTLFFPSKEEVYLPSLGAETLDLTLPFIPELEKRGIAYLDLGPAFRQRAAAGEKLFFEVDGHPNAHGYALIAEEVLTYLREHGHRYGLEGLSTVSSAAGS